MFGGDAHHHQVAQQLEQALSEPLRVGAGGHRPAHGVERGGCVAGDARLGDAEQQAPVDQVENLGHLFVVHVLTAESDDLVEQCLGVAQRSVRFAGDCEQTRIRHFDVFFPAHHAQALGDFAGSDAPQVITLAAGHDREGDLFRIGGGEDEEAPRRRFLQRLEQRVEGCRREHVDFVHDVDPVLSRGRRVANRLDDLAHVVDARAACGVDLLHVGRAPLDDLPAGRALGAGCVGGALLAVEAAREDSRQRRLADAARARQQYGVRHAVHANRVAQGRGDVLLANDVVEGAGSPLACENLVAHGGSVPLEWRGPEIAGHPRSQPKSRYRCFLPDLTEFTRFVIERDPAIAAPRRRESTGCPPGGQTPSWGVPFRAPSPGAATWCAGGGEHDFPRRRCGANSGAPVAIRGGSRFRRRCPDRVRRAAASSRISHWRCAAAARCGARCTGGSCVRPCARCSVRAACLG